jgi:hypothetical protein
LRLPDVLVFFDDGSSVNAMLISSRLRDEDGRSAASSPADWKFCQLLSAALLLPSRKNGGNNMAKPLSEQLAALSVHAKKAEDTVAAAQEETHDEIMSRWEQARADARATTEKVNKQIQSMGDSAAKDWNARKAKIAADMDALKAKVIRKKHELDARRAEREADRLESDASLAIDYAIAAVDQARLAVLDAVAGRIQAEDARGAA